jgi:hypothetical protein
MPNPIKKATYKEFLKVIVIFEPVEINQSPSVTNCQCHCDTGEVSFKFKCPNKRRGRLIISDKLSVDRLTATLKVGNFNLQTATSESELRSSHSRDDQFDLKKWLRITSALSLRNLQLKPKKQHYGP